MNKSKNLLENYVKELIRFLIFFLFFRRNCVCVFLRYAHMADGNQMNILVMVDQKEINSFWFISSSFAFDIKRKKNNNLIIITLAYF